MGSREREASETTGLRLLAPKVLCVPGPAGWQHWVGGRLCHAPSRARATRGRGSSPGRRGGEDSGNGLCPGRWSESGGWAGAEERSRRLATSARSPGSGDPQVSRTAWESYARNAAREGRGWGASCSPRPEPRAAGGSTAAARAPCGVQAGSCASGPAASSLAGSGPRYPEGSKND